MAAYIMDLSGLSPIMSKLSQMYNLPPLDERKPVVRGFTAGLYLVLATILSLPHRRLRIFLFLSLALPVAMKLPHTTAGDPARDYWLGTLFVGSVYRGLDYIVLTDADRQLYRVAEGGRKSEKNRGEKEKEPRAQTWSLAKWLWCASVWANNRGVNCSWEVTNIEPKPRVGYPVWWGNQPAPISRAS
ncbi:hypothetical protein GP486_005766 [Trichoglossum hirsutum]|uniref:Wax synthase domain-containing protein n=1 Tax=Trichoglossum hirsutum TaxID=265104 RepID=A0A9P8RLM6_9PEZI|nr:hypothetical protein GP486_005766 [Trichoglossum hirsutum]